MPKRSRRYGCPLPHRSTASRPSSDGGFRQLMGWDRGGPVVAMPTTAERAHRGERERWKRDVAGTGQRERCFLLTASVTDQTRRSLAVARDLRVWYRALVRQAERVAALPDAVWATVVPKQGPWNVAGSYCPNCYGTKSDRSIYGPRWAWSAREPERISCPDCDMGYPNDSFPEEGSLSLPRLGLEYRFHIDAAERNGDWRAGRNASRFGGAPTHVSFSGELRRAKLSWALGQVEPLATAYAVTGSRPYAETAATILWRLAQVYGSYPLYCYMQEYVDADPGRACAMVDQLPTGFRRGEWGAARIAREKAGTGQVLLALLRAYELIHQTIDRERCITIERELLLEM